MALAQLDWIGGGGTNTDITMKLVGSNASWATDLTFSGASTFPFTKIKAIQAGASGLSSLQVLVDNVNVWNNGMTWDTDYDVSNASRIVIVQNGTSNSAVFEFQLH